LRPYTQTVPKQFAATDLRWRRKAGALGLVFARRQSPQNPRSAYVRRVFGSPRSRFLTYRRGGYGGERLAVVGAAPKLRQFGFSAAGSMPLRSAARVSQSSTHRRSIPEISGRVE
jgi:hypothetical protein